MRSEDRVSNLSLFAGASDPSPHSFYVGVMRFGAEGGHDWHSFITHGLVALLLGDEVQDTDEKECSKKSRRDYVRARDVITSIESVTLH